MKKLVILFALIVALTVSAVAQTEQKPYTPNEEEKIREGVAAIMQYVQAEQNLDSNAIKSGQIEVVDVVDKALDKFGSAVTFVYANLEKAAPKVWQIMVWQQYAKAISGFVGPILALLLIFFVYRYLNRHWTQANDASWNETFGTRVAGFWFRNIFTKALPLFAAFVTCWVSFETIQTGILLLVNPRYYAIRDLLVMLLGNSHGM